MTGISYSVTAQNAALLITAIFLVYSFLIRPEATPRLKVLMCGFFLALLSTTLECVVAACSVNYYSNLDPAELQMAIMVLALVDLLLMLSMVVYVSMMIPHTKHSQLHLNGTLCLFTLFYVIFFFINYRAGKFMIDTGNGYDVHYLIYFLCDTGTVCVVICIISVIYNHRRLSRILVRGIAIFSPLLILAIAIQALNPTVLISGLIYLIPLMIQFLLFHTVPLDPTTGSLGAHSLDSAINSCLRKQHSFCYVAIRFPELLGTFSRDTAVKIQEGIAGFSREVEQKFPHANVYRIGRAEFVIMNPCPAQSKEANDFLSYCCGLAVRVVTSSPIATYYNLAGFIWNDHLKSAEECHLFKAYLQQKISHKRGSAFILGSVEDMEDYDETTFITRELKDINDKLDLNDPRVLCYAQPIYDVESGTFRTAESLMRLELGGRIIPPNLFIPIAEQNHYIHALTLIMINKVCNAIDNLSDDFDFDGITVNCSASEFSSRHMSDDVIRVLNRHPRTVSPKLRFELTESSLLDNLEKVQVNIDKLQEDEGIKFYLDDFGTGYSNLDRITTYTFDTIKFDKSILYKALEEEDTEELIRMLVQLLKRRGIRPLVEGVENEDQARFCIDHGFESIQGFHYARPRPIEDLRQAFEPVSR